MLCALIRIASSRRYNHCVENRKFLKLSLFASWTGAMINPQWLELPMSRTNFHGPKDVRAIEVRLYLFVQLVPLFVTKRRPVHFILNPGHV